MWDVQLLFGEGGDVARGGWWYPVFEEDSLVQIIKIEFFLVKTVQFLVVQWQQFGAEEVGLFRVHLEQSTLFQMPKISLKPIGDVLVVINALNKEEVENLLMNPGVDLLPAELAQIVLALGKVRRLVVVPGVNQRKAQGVCQHAGVIDDLQWSLEHLVPELDVQQPHKLSQGL